MWFKTASDDITYLNCNIDLHDSPTIHAAKLLHIRGNAALHTHVFCDHADRYLSQIMLYDTPLIQINAPECPTCCSLLASGYGIQNADCPQLQEVRDRLNAPFVSLEASIEDLRPLLILLESGLYIIADAECYPSDGEGHFFWDIDNKPKEYAATAGVYHTDTFAYTDGQPVYLFPTQDSDCYDASRVEHYRRIMEDGSRTPRAVVYNFTAFMNFVLDGHHKACAAALQHTPLKSIIIIPLSSMEYRFTGGRPVPEKLCFSSISIPVNDIPEQYVPPLHEKQTSPFPITITKGTIAHRVWEDTYTYGAQCFPSVMELAEILEADISIDDDIHDDTIQELLHSADIEDSKKLEAVLYILKWRNDPRLKQTLMACASRKFHHSLSVKAYQMLSDMRNDPDIEQFFITYIAEYDDIHDDIYQIVLSYL